jgi:hypothetical protein
MAEGLEHLGLIPRCNYVVLGKFWFEGSVLKGCLVSECVSVVSAIFSLWA